MKNGRPNRLNHFFLPEDQRLFDYNQIFCVSSMWVELGMENTIATYDLLVRGLPGHRNFLLFGGLEEIITGIQSWRFTKEEIAYLKKNGSITAKMAKILKTFKFSGDIYAMPEGSIFFSNEPVVRLTAPIWQINLFTLFLINAITSNTTFLSKVVRGLIASQGQFKVITCPAARAQANEAALKYGRAVYILGGDSTLVPAFARKFKLPFKPVSTKAYHAFIKSFPTELEAMRAAASIFKNISFMVDTYDTKKGIDNAIIVGLEMRAKYKKLDSITIDSGKDTQDFIQQSRYARQKLDQAGLKDVGIVVAGNFEEYKIAELAAAKAPISGVLLATEFITSADEPILEAVLKLAEYKKGQAITYCAKLAAGKESYPGRKQVFRRYDKNGRLKQDIIGLENEKLGTPLLRKIVHQGRLVAKLPVLDEIKNYTLKQLELLPTALKKIDKPVKYRVDISRELKNIFEETKKKHTK